MSHFHELYWAHVEQLGLRYPDAYHIRYAWANDTDRIESKVVLAGDGIDVFVSVLDPDGTIRHYAEPYTPYHNSPRERAIA